VKLTDTIPVWLRAPRSTLWLLAALVLLGVIAFVSPVQLPVVLYKAALISLAAVMGYWLDRALFPYARPDSYLVRDWRHGTDQAQGEVDYPIVMDYAKVYCVAMLRRAVVVGAVIVGVAMGL